MPTKQSLRLATAERLASCAIALFAVVAISGCGSSNASSSATATSATVNPLEHPANTTIRLQNIAIHPAKVTISRGSTVTWRWLDGDIDTAHNVTSVSGGLQFKPSGTRLTGSYSVRFDRPGKYFYECTIHPASMQGEIIVQ